MQTLKFESREEWLGTRLGKITGSRLDSVVSKGGPTKEMIVRELTAAKVAFKSTAKKEELELLLTPESRANLISQLPKKIGFYELIAERLGVPPDGENPMERGSRLESEAIERFSKEEGKKVDTSLVIWTREDDEDIAISPDGIVSEEEAVEVKCLSSARHIEAYLTKKVPDEYWMQVLQYFIVNDKLQALNFVCYDPRFVMFTEESGKKNLDYFVIEVLRGEVEEEAAGYLEYQKKTLAEVRQVVNNLTF